MGVQEKSRIYNNVQEHYWEKLIEFAFQIVISSLPHFIWQQCYPFSCSTKTHEAILDLWRSRSQNTYPIHQDILFAWVSNCICTWTTSYHYSKMQTEYLPQFQQFQNWLFCSFIFPQGFLPPAHWKVSSFITVACCLSPLTRIWIPWGQDPILFCVPRV